MFRTSSTQAVVLHRYRVGEIHKGLLLLTLDMGINSIGPNVDFTIFANSSTIERYRIRLWSDGWTTPTSWWTDCTDTKDWNFITPATPDVTWRYVEIIATSGERGDGPFGPDIDAVGFDV